jgi:hypothetical protein
VIAKDDDQMAADRNAYRAAVTALVANCAFLGKTPNEIDATLTALMARLAASENLAQAV